MRKVLKVGDHVSWNSEAGRVRGKITRKFTHTLKVKGYFRHATRQNPYYMIKSDKTDHVAVHQGSALRKLTPYGLKKSA